MRHSQKNTATNTLLSLLIVFISASLVSINAWAELETEKRFENYVVHYSLFNSSFINADVANAYEIVRSKEKVLINISIIDHSNPEAPKPVKGLVKGTVSNLLGQKFDLDFDQIREKNAIYYLSDLRVSNGELFHFDIKIKPNPNKPPFQLKFSRTLYKDK